MKIWLVTDRRQCRGDFLQAVAEAARGGLEAIILREKDLGPAWLYTLALQVKQIAAEYGTKLLVGGSVEVAAAVEAAGVHLGKDALPPDVVRRKLGYRGLVGVSVHSAGQAIDAEAAGADYLLTGHIFATRSKPGLEPRGPELLAAVKRACSLPQVAIGGITPENAAQVFRQGIEDVAVISYIMGHADPCRAVRQLRRRPRARGNVALLI